VTAAQSLFAGALMLANALVMGFIFPDGDQLLRTEVFIGALAAAGVGLIWAGLAKLVLR